MTLRHLCDDTLCPYAGQPSPKSCRCHKIDERMLREQRDELLAALRKAVKWLAITDDPRCGKDLTAAEEAIRKATGEPA